jgi:formylglycine-generating enzyme required for sulfatase activity
VNDTGYFTIRGGSWVSPDRQLLQGSSRDDAYRPESRSALVGFRCARTRSL